MGRGPQSPMSSAPLPRSSWDGAAWAPRPSPSLYPWDTIRGTGLSLCRAVREDAARSGLRHLQPGSVIARAEPRGVVGGSRLVVLRPRPILGQTLPCCPLVQKSRPPPWAELHRATSGCQGQQHLPAAGSQPAPEMLFARGRRWWAALCSPRGAIPLLPRPASPGASCPETSLLTPRASAHYLFLPAALPHPICCSLCP